MFARYLLIAAASVLLFAGSAAAQEPIFFSGGIQTYYQSSPGVAAATAQIVAGTASGAQAPSPGWLLGVSYAVDGATSEVKIKDALGHVLNSAELADKAPIWQVARTSSTGEQSQHIEFKYPRFFASGMVIEATGAIVNVEYIEESRRIRLQN